MEAIKNLTNSTITLNTTEQKFYQGGSVQPVDTDRDKLIRLIDKFLSEQ